MAGAQFHVCSSLDLPPSRTNAATPIAPLRHPAPNIWEYCVLLRARQDQQGPKDDCGDVSIMACALALILRHCPFCINDADANRRNISSKSSCDQRWALVRSRSTRRGCRRAGRRQSVATALRRAVACSCARLRSPSTSGPHLFTLLRSAPSGHETRPGFSMTACCVLLSGEWERR